MKVLWDSPANIVIELFHLAEFTELTKLTHTDIHKCVQTCTHTYICTHTCTHTCTYTHTCMYALTHTHTYVTHVTHAHVYKNTSTTYKRIKVHSCTHTHTHTHMQVYVCTQRLTLNQHGPISFPQETLISSPCLSIHADMQSRRKKINKQDPHFRKVVMRAKHQWLWVHLLSLKQTSLESHS